MPYAPLLDDAQVEAGLARLSGWRREGQAIVRDLRFATFPLAIEFVRQVADLAEAADHHPDIDIRWRTVRLVLTTHASGGLTARDLDLAERIDQLDEIRSLPDEQATAP